MDNDFGLRWDETVETCGTSLQGYFEHRKLSFVQQADGFAAESGQPRWNASGDGKVTVEFCGTFDGAVFTLYDYKGDDTFHIGGRDGLDVEGLKRALRGLLG
jgi:hypothetical protein